MGVSGVRGAAEMASPAGWEREVTVPEPLEGVAYDIETAETAAGSVMWPPTPAPTLEPTPLAVAGAEVIIAVGGFVCVFWLGWWVRGRMDGRRR